MHLCGQNRLKVLVAAASGSKRHRYEARQRQRQYGASHPLGTSAYVLPRLWTRSSLDNLLHEVEEELRHREQSRLDYIAGGVLKIEHLLLRSFLAERLDEAVE